MPPNPLALVVVLVVGVAVGAEPGAPQRECGKGPHVIKIARPDGDDCNTVHCYLMPPLLEGGSYEERCMSTSLYCMTTTRHCYSDYPECGGVGMPMVGCTGVPAEEKAE